MKKFFNSVETMLAESLTGFCAAHHDLVQMGAEGRFVRRRTINPAKVQLIAGGGAGHEPMHAGYVGFGMLDAACPGQIFTSPTPGQIAAAASELAGTAGTVFIVKNYQGDLMNFEMAAETLAGPHATIIVADDVMTDGASRRGLAGTVIVEKMLGAAAEAGADLAAIVALAGRVLAVTRTAGVALTSATSPAMGRPTFDIGPGDMEFGVGIHGERGLRRDEMRGADALFAEVCEALLASIRPARGAQMLVMVNGFGGTPMMELHLVFDAVRRALAAHGVIITRNLVGNYATSLDMAGCSVTMTVLDAELTALWDAPVHTPALRWRL